MMTPFELIGGKVELRELNGQLGAVFRDRHDHAVNALRLDILDGQVQTIRAVLNPDKLRHLGPVADAWAVLREVSQPGQPTIGD